MIRGDRARKGKNEAAVNELCSKFLVELVRSEAYCLVSFHSKKCLSGTKLWAENAHNKACVRNYITTDVTSIYGIIAQA